MKIRCDFVTNSSSSSFMCLMVDGNMEKELLLANGMTSDEVCEKAYDESLDEVKLMGNRMVAVVGECEVEYVGWSLLERDITDKTLTQLKEEMIVTIWETYGIRLEKDDIWFNYGEIDR